ncbi:MAG: ABC transporter ATP-binding protein [bacterium]
MILEARGLGKRFGPVVALDQVDLELDRGEVLAVLGENGAGKSTLMNVLFGALAPDAGEIRWHGRNVAWGSPAGALAAGVGMVHQHFTLLPALSVLENVWLSHPDRPRFSLDLPRARVRLLELSERFGLDLDLSARVGDLPVGAQQRVEIAKALARSPEVLILDEPTAVLAPEEVDRLFAGVRALVAAGTSVLFISHKLDEVLEIADRVTVLRRGRVTATCRRDEADVPLLTRSIVGDGATSWARAGRTTVTREPAETSPPSPSDEAPVRPALLEVRDLTRAADRFGPGLARVSFRVARGELVGVAGVDGNGQQELAAVLAGVLHATQGSIRLAGKELRGQTPEERWRLGLSVLPGDRREEGLVGAASIRDNLALREFGAPWAREGLLVNVGVHDARAVALMERHDVRAPGPEALAESLSGGNQQKLLLARELAGAPKMLVLLHPTRGLDIGAADSTLRTLRALADDGCGVVVISAELDELLAWADRVAVLHRGTWHESPARSRREIGALMVGAHP